MKAVKQGKREQLQTIEASWPTEGKLEIQNLHVRYREDLPMVLKGINATFPACKKIGIVGRTGSGLMNFPFQMSLNVLSLSVQPSGV